jgi:hypothetical protein
VRLTTSRKEFLSQAIKKFLPGSCQTHSGVERIQFRSQLLLGLIAPRFVIVRH